VLFSLFDHYYSVNERNGLFQTPVLHALGVASKDEAVWTLPDK